MEPLGGAAHLDVPEDSYKLVPLRDNLLLLNGPHYVNILKLGDSVLSSHQYKDDTNKRNIFRFLPASNQILHVGKDNTVKTLSPTYQGIYVLGDTLNDSAVRLSFQESVYLLETLQDSEMNWGPDTEDISQRVAFQLQHRLAEFQLLPPKKQHWLECVLEGSYADLEPLFEDIASQPISDPEQSSTLNKMLQRLRYNAGHHLKHPSASPVVSVSVSPTEEIVVTGSTDGNIAIWDISTTPRLVNTINGLDNLLEVLMGEVLITVHQPNVIIVHQIGEHALSETLFQKTLEGTVLIGATYLSATHKIALALNVISSPSRANYFLQTASVNLADRTLELGDRVRVEGSFAALAKANTHTVSITDDGALTVFDTVSSETHNFKKPQSNYRFTDITSGFNHVYATTLAGAILSFNLSSVPRAPAQTASPSKAASNTFGYFNQGNDDGFGNFSAAQGSSDSFGGFSAAQGSSDGFGDFSAAQGGSDNAFGDFSAPQGFGNFSSPQNDDGFGDFSAPQSASTSQPNQPDAGFAASPKVVNGTPPQKRNSIPNNDFMADFGATDSFAKPPPQASPKFTLEDRPGAAVAGSAATHNNSTGDFGEIPFVESGSAHNSPVMSSSKLRKSIDHFTESPVASPMEQPADVGDFGNFSKSSPVKGSPQLSRQELKTSGTSPIKSPLSMRKATFGGFDTNNQFGGLDTSDHFGTTTSEQFGNFGDQGDQFGDFGATPQPNGLATHQAPQALKDSQPKGDLADFSDFSAAPSSGASSNNNNNAFGDLEQHNSGNFGDFGVTSNISSSPSTIPPPNLRSSPVNLPSPASPVPALHSSANFRLSSSTLPTSPSIFSQDDFSFDTTPPPVSLSQSGTHAQSPTPVTKPSGGFDAFGDDDFGVPPPAQTQSPKPARGVGSPATSPKKDELIGDFGEFGGNSAPSTAQTDADDDFGFGTTATTTTSQNFGNSTDSPQFGFGDFAASEGKKDQPNDLDDFSATPAPTDDLGNFGGNSAAPHTGDFGETSSPQTNSFDDFGETAPTQADNFGDFGESPATNQDDDDDFGHFGESVAPVQPSKPLEGDFGEFSKDDAPQAASQNAFGDDDDDGFGNFAQTTTSGGETKDDDDDGFGDFGDFSKPQDDGDDDGFGDFGGFSGTTTTADQGDFGFGDSDTPAATPTPAPAPVEPTPPPPPAAPQVPSIFSEADETQLKSALEQTFATAFASLIPSSLTTPHSPRRRLPTELDLEATLKGQDSSSTLHTPKCPQCGVQLRTPDAAMCLACGTPAQGASQFTPWSGLVLPPNAEIKFWDALGVPIRQLTEKMKETQPAFSSTTGVLTPSILTPTVQTIPATQTALNSSWGLGNDNPFAPTATPSSAKPSGATPAATTSTTAKPQQQQQQQHLAANTSATHTQAASQGFDGDPFHSPAATPLSSSGSTRAPAPSSSIPASKSPSLTSTPGPAAAVAAPNSADEDYFLSFSTSSSLKAPPPKPHAILSSVSASASSPPTHPWSQFLARIPDLSFVIADRLSLPSSSSSSS